MSVQITVRNVPESVRDILASRAAMQGKSMQEYLLAELEHSASRPTIESWLEQVRRRKAAAKKKVPVSRILSGRAQNA